MAVFRTRLALPLVLAGLWFSLASTGCRDPGGGAADAGNPADPDADSNYPAPRTDLVPSVGSQTTFELATWNIENFPKGETTAKTVADIIASLDVDMVAVQEIQNQAAFEEIVARLRGYDGLVSSHEYGDGSYQKVGYIYRTDLVSVTGAFRLFDNNGYEYPRPAFKVDVVVQADTPISFTAVALHLKAGLSFDDRTRREDAVSILESYMRTTVDGGGNGQMVALGDFNDSLDSGAAVFAPLTSATDRYTVRTTGNEAAGDVSFVPSGVLIDHIITTSAFDDAFGAGTTIIPRLDMQMTGYESQISDHLPVIMRLPL